MSSPRLRSIAPLVAIVALIAGTTVAACGRGQGAPAAEYAVYAEYSLSNKPMVAGWNARVFNKKEVQEGENIGLDDRTGVVTLRAGLYHITAMSLVNSYDVANPTSIPTLSTPPAGYARLRYLEDALSPDVVPTIDVLNANNAKALSIGTGSDANALPSFMETFLRVQDKASLVVEHQVGNDVRVSICRSTRTARSGTSTRESRSNGSDLSRRVRPRHGSAGGPRRGRSRERCSGSTRFAI